MSKPSVMPKPTMTIEEVAAWLQQELNNRWEAVLAEHEEELRGLWPELEDSTYGVYLDKLLPPLFGALAEAGFTPAGEPSETDFIIGGALNFSHSMEQWGPEHHRSRVFWVVLEQGQAGALLIDFFHSHAGFEVPAVPRIIATRKTEHRALVAEVRQLKSGQ